MRSCELQSDDHSHDHGRQIEVQDPFEATQIAQGKKVRIPLKLTKKQMRTIAAALKKHKKVTAALSASINSSVGLQVTKALVVTVKR